MPPEEIKEAMADANPKPTAEQMQEAVRAAIAQRGPTPPPAPTHLYTVTMNDGEVFIWKSGDMLQLVEAMPNVICLGQNLFLYAEGDIALNVSQVRSIKREGAIVVQNEEGTIEVEEAKSETAEQQ